MFFGTRARRARTFRLGLAAPIRSNDIDTPPRKRLVKVINETKSSTKAFAALTPSFDAHGRLLSRVTAPRCATYVMAARPIAKEEAYTVKQKASIIAAVERGEVAISARFDLGINEDSVKRLVRRWRAKAEARGHLSNLKRGAETGVKFVLDRDELELIRDANEKFPDMMANEMILWLKAQGCRYVVCSARSPPPERFVVSGGTGSPFARRILVAHSLRDGSPLS
jgi:hypothetical protein